MASHSFLDLLSPPILWFFIGFVLFLAELAVPTLIIFFFGFGAWLTSLALIIWDPPIYHQLLIFLVSSLLCLSLLRDSLRKRFLDSGQDVEGCMDNDHVGKHAIVVEPIRPPMRGRISLNGTQWDACSEVMIDEGMTVEIINKESITFIVIPVQSVDS